MSAVWAFDFHAGQLYNVLQEALLDFGAYLVEFVQIDEQEVVHGLQRLTLLAQGEIV